jgi:hypothetical protein
MGGSIFAAGPERAARCRAQQAPPRVAFCITGAARSFASPLVLAALRNNLVAPLAGTDPAGGGSRFFLSLKASDSPKSGVYGVSFGRHVSSIGPLVEVCRPNAPP